MKKKLIPLLLTLAILSSCRKEHFNTDEFPQSKGDIILFERPTNDPIILKNTTGLRLKASTSLQGDEEIIDPRYYIGRSYDGEASDIGSPLGVRYPIVDIKNLIKDQPDLFKPIKINESKSEVFSFIGFDSYWQKTNSTKTVNGGFSLNLGLFSIGAKSKFTNTFSSTILSENKRVYGELDGYFISNSYSYLFSNNMIDNIKQNYLSTSFLNELYNSSPYEFVKNYGTFVIKDFNTGGRVNALFTGIYTANSDSLTKTKSMDNAINASFKFKKGDDSTNSVNIGNQNGNGTSIATKNNFSNLLVSVRTYGGNAGIDNFTAPKSIDQTSFNLSNWGNSLNDAKNNVLIGFNQNGLLPLSDFIMESNLASNIKNYITNGGGLSQKQLMEPVIECRWIIAGPNSGSFVVVLRTRFGDQLFLHDGTVKWAFDGKLDSKGWPIISQSSMNQFLTKAREVASSKLKYYKLKVVALQPSSESQSFSPINYSTFMSYVQEGSMKKYYDNKKKITYLLYEGVWERFGEMKKFAYAIHDDYILDTYGIRDWVSKLATTNISYNDLKKYEIIAL